MDIQKICGHCDHTLLRVDSTWEQIRALCDEGVQYHAASVCIPPCYAAEAVKYLNGRLPVTVVVGFPNGYSTTAAKVCEAEEAVRSGVSDIDMVINVCYVKDGRFDLVEEDIRAVREATRGHVLKVIIECALLTDEEKIRLCEIVTRTGCDYIKTSTGFAAHGATPEDVKLLRAHVGAEVKVKAAGGIHTLEEAEHYMQLGAERLGTSSIIKEVIRLQDIEGFLQTNANIDRSWDPQL